MSIEHKINSMDQAPKAMKKSEITRERILESADSLFLTKGYHHTSLDNILDLSGTSKGNFYFHFKSKEELGYAYLDRCLEKFNEQILPQLYTDDVKNPINRLINFLDATFDKHKEQKGIGGCPFGNFAVEMSDVHNGFRNKIELVFGSWENEMSKALNLAKEEGVLSSTINTRKLSVFVLAVIQGSLILMRARKNLGILDDCNDILKDVLNKYMN